MSQTPNGFEDNVLPLILPDENALVVRRIELCDQLGAVMLDMDRYNSLEWFDVVAAIGEVTRQIREQRIETSRYHSSISFPMRRNPAAAVVRERRNEAISYAIPPPDPIDIDEVA